MGRHSNTPVLLVYSLGLLGSLRISCLSLQVHSATRQNTLFDLRLLPGFPQLDAYVQTFDLPSLDPHSFSHIPYVVILHKALQLYQTTHSALPDTFS